MRTGRLRRAAFLSREIPTDASHWQLHAMHDARDTKSQQILLQDCYTASVARLLYLL